MPVQASIDELDDVQCTNASINMGLSSKGFRQGMNAHRKASTEHVPFESASGISFSLPQLMKQVL